MARYSFGAPHYAAFYGLIDFGNRKAGCIATTKLSTTREFILFPRLTVSIFFLYFIKPCNEVVLMRNGGSKSGFAYCTRSEIEGCWKSMI